MSGKFITLEGIEGVGKSTQLKFIKNYLKKRNQPAVFTREPGGTPVAEAMRQILLHPHGEKVTQETELLLLFASRSQHIAQVIKPALEKEEWVVCDRFTDASYAYQGAGRGISVSWIAMLEKEVQKGLQPDLVLLLDLPARIALRRIQRRKKIDRIESEKIDFFERVRKAYLTRAKAHPERYKILNAGLPLSRVSREIEKILEHLIVTNEQ